MSDESMWTHEFRPSASEALAGVLDHPPALAALTLRSGIRLTTRWTHGPLHDYLPGMDGHVIGATHSGQGAALHIHENRKVPGRIQRGVVTIVPEGKDGYWDIFEPTCGSLVFLPESHFRSVVDVLAPGRTVTLVERVTFHDPILYRIQEILSNEPMLGDPASCLFVEQALDLLCTQLIRGHSTYSALPAMERRRGLADWQLRRVREYMDANLHEVVTLDDLASTVSLNRHYFCTVFHQTTNTTPHEFLTMLRMQRAKELMEDPRVNISTIALAVGYRTASAFTASFRRVTGLSPSAYRRLL